MLRTLAFAVVLLAASSQAAESATFPVPKVETMLAVVDATVTPIVPDKLVLPYKAGHNIARVKAACVKNLDAARINVTRLRNRVSMNTAIQLALNLDGLSECLGFLSSLLHEVQGPPESVYTALAWGDCLTNVLDSLSEVRDIYIDALLALADDADKALPH